MSNSIYEFSDEELMRRLRDETESVYWTPNNCLVELDRRAQLRNAAAMNRWTAIITIATSVNVLAAVLQAVATAGYFKNN